MRVMVTGGGGFLGAAIVRKLRARGDTVRSFSRGEYPELTRLGVECARGDLADATAVAAAAAGMEAVLHVAAKPGIWGAEEEYYRTNVLGTQQVLAACRTHRIPRLVYTSSPSVVHGSLPLEGVDEAAPYPADHDAAYPRTKALAERAVLAANGPTLATVALRPHMIWGPGDHHLVPRLIARARAGELRKVGDGRCKVDHTYVDNAADAHLLALDRLAPGAAIAGKVYFISNGEPIAMGDLLDRILAAAGLSPVTESVPPWLAWAAGACLEAVYGACHIREEPRMTRFLARQLSTPHWFNISAARRDLGYVPQVTLDEGLRRLAEHLRGGGAAAGAGAGA
ncbi:MAG: NAD-dependent epimerase/dehydratase family protein [Planctomycetes bacterium]|nr:NAD-dependent epimerase/dehydratase family protein [Planctomycetota bacterium]